MDPQHRWQHLVLYISASGLLGGSIILIIAFTGRAGSKATPWPIGAAMIGISLAVGFLAWRSLRKAQARSHLLMQLDRGLYQLDETSPLPLVELNAAIVRHFGFPYQDPKEAMPRTFGELVRSVTNVAADSASITPLQYDDARTALTFVVGRRPESVSWCCKMVDVLPGGRRRYRLWQNLRNFVPALPPAMLNAHIEKIGFYIIFAALIAVAVPIARYLDRNPSTHVERTPLLEIVGHVAGIMLFGVLIAIVMIPVILIGRRFASRVPPSFDRLDALAAVFPLNPDDQGEWTTELVEAHLRDLASDTMKIRPDLMRLDTPFAR